MLKDDEIFLTHLSVREINEYGKFLGDRREVDHVKNITLSDVCKNGRSIVTQSCAFRREVFLNFGIFREKLTNEGPVMAFRAATLGKVVYLERPLSFYRIGTGVSTYAGNNCIRMKEDEPVKISNWRRTAFLQIAQDANAIPRKLTQSQRTDIVKNVKFYENLWKVNMKKRVGLRIFKTFLLKPLDGKTLRAALRVTVPLCVYAWIRIQSASINFGALSYESSFGNLFID